METDKIRDGQAGATGPDDRGSSRFLARLFGVEGAAEVGLGFAHWPEAGLVAALSWAIAVCLFVAMWAHWPKK